MRPFRFAVTAARAASAEAWREKARRAEALGYDALLMIDHFGDQLAPVPALMAAADATTRLRIGSFVFANDYRNPVMLAKEIATLDVLSGGRLEFGIGAGWRTSDYEQLGIPYDAPRVRVDRMEESVRLLKALFAQERTDFDGRHYRVRGARGLPKPLQRPHPPLMIGGGGPRMLRIAAREADVVAFAPQVTASGRPRLSDISTGALARKVERLRAAAGERFERLELNLIVFDAAVTGDRGSFAHAVATRFKWALAAIFDCPYFLFGSLRELRELVERRREALGISYYAIPDHAMEEFAPLVAELRGR